MMDPKYEKIASQGSEATEKFLTLFGKVVSPSTKDALQKAVAQQRGENLVAAFRQMPGIRDASVQVMPPNVFKSKTPEEMASYSEAYEKVYEAMDKARKDSAHPKDYSALLKESKYFVKGRIDLSTEDKARSFLAAFSSCPSIPNAVASLPQYASPFEVVDPKVSYDVDDVKEVGKYPPRYAYSQKALQTKEDAIEAKEQADALRATQKEKWRRFFILGILPGLILLGVACVLSFGLGFLLPLIPGWTEGAYATGWVPFFMLLSYVLAALTIRIVTDVLPTKLFRDHPDYNAVKGLSLIASGVLRVVMVFAAPLCYFRFEGSYWWGVLQWGIVCLVGFLFQFFLQERKRTYYAFLLLEVLAGLLLMSYVPQSFSLVDEATGVSSWNPWALLLYAAVGLSLFGYGYLAKPSADRFLKQKMPFGAYFTRFLWETLTHILVPMVLFAVALLMQKWTRSWFYLWPEVYEGTAPFSFALWGHITLQIIYVLLFLGGSSVLLGFLRGGISDLVDPENRFRSPSLTTRFFWTTVDAYLVFLVLSTGFPGYYAGILDGQTIALSLIAMVPFFLFPFLFCRNNGKKPIPMFGWARGEVMFPYTTLFMALAFPMVTMMMLNCHGGHLIGLAIYGEVFVFAICYGAHWLSYVMEDF
ncbi:MAG: hypothetical protein K6E59_03505 [Bacilli bacterium]|nr:hypothetical protein [Bacilli bacterium]